MRCTQLPSSTSVPNVPFILLLPASPADPTGHWCSSYKSSSMKRLLTVSIAVLAILRLIAQDATLMGIVRDEQGQPVIGANVTFAPGKGAATDPDGRYSFSLPSGEQEVTFSFVGFDTRKERIVLAPGEARTLDMVMTTTATQLDMVVVTAGRFEQRVGEVTQSLSVLRPEIVLNKNVVSMSDALDQVPGVIIVDEEPQIRAGSGFSYGAGSRVQVLVDDIPILSGDIGRPNWTFLPIENLEQVEVIKGASSVLYGSAALSGVINVRTAYPRDRPRTRVTMFTGMYDDPERREARWWGENNPMISGVNFFHSQQLGALDLVVGGNAFSDAGYIGPEPAVADSAQREEPAGYDNRVRFNIGTRWRNKKIQGLNYGINANAMKSRSTAVLIWNNSEEGLYRPLPGTVTRTLGTQFYVDPFINYHSRSGTRHSLRMRLHQQEFDNDNDQSNSNQVVHGEYQVQQRVDLFGETTITAGVVYRLINSQARLYSGDEDGDGVNQALNTAAYLQLDKKLLERISLSAGVRYERFQVNELDDAQPVFRAGINWQALRATYIRASYGQGFRFPTIGERFISTSVGLLSIFPNADIRAERSTNIEAGVKQGFRIGGFQGYFDAVAFQQDIEDFVEFTFGQWVPATGFSALGFKSVNTGSARISGIELELTGQGSIGPVGIGALIGYTHTRPISLSPDEAYGRSYSPPHTPYTYNTTSHDTTGRILKFRVEQMFRGDIQFTYKRYMAGMSVRYNSHVRNIDKAFVELDEVGLLTTGVSEWMKEYSTGDTILDLRLGANVTDVLRVAFIVNNLTNLEYAIRPLAVEAPRNFQVQMMLDLK